MNVFSNFIFQKVNSFLVKCPLKSLVLFIIIRLYKQPLNLSKEEETSFGNVISSQVVASERIYVD